MAIGSVVVASGTGDSAAVGAHAFLRLCGWSVSEDAGVTAAVSIRHGTAATDPLLVAPMNLAANGFGMWGISNQGIPCPNGIYVDRTSGTTTVILYVDRI